MNCERKESQTAYDIFGFIRSRFGSENFINFALNESVLNAKNNFRNFASNNHKKNPLKIHSNISNGNLFTSSLEQSTTLKCAAILHAQLQINASPTRSSLEFANSRLLLLCDVLFRTYDYFVINAINLSMEIASFHIRLIWRETWRKWINTIFACK